MGGDFCKPSMKGLRPYLMIFKHSVEQPQHAMVFNLFGCKFARNSDPLRGSFRVQ